MRSGFDSIFFLLCLLIGHAASWAQQPYLTEQMVLQSVVDRYPKIIEQDLLLQAARENIVSKEGAFDSKLVVQGDQRLSGPYEDAQAGLVGIERRFQPLGLKTRLNYRVSDQAFPSYEENLATLDQGEWSFFAEVSLLRNRRIDSFRYQIRKGQLDALKVEKDRDQLIQMLSAEARLIYWSWRFEAQRLRVLRGLLDLAETRQKALERRVKSGASAKIDLTENTQVIEQRRAKLIEEELKFNVISQYLSLYLRSEDGRRIQPSIEQAEAIVSPEEIIQGAAMTPLDSIDVVRRQPAMARLKVQRDILDLQVLQGENKLLPDVRLGVKASEDRGDNPYSSSTLAGYENRVFLNIEIPLERRDGNGTIGQLKAQKKALDQRIRLLSDNIEVQYQTLQRQIDALKASTMSFYKSYRSAALVQKAEAKRFQNGISNLFLLNTRESNAANAYLAWLSSLSSLQKKRIEYLALIQPAKPSAKD